MSKNVDRDKKRQEIMHAALILFSDKGFESASMAQVAVKAGIGKGTIYEYFNTKEELFLLALKNWLDGLCETGCKHVAHVSDPLERLRAYLNETMQDLVKDPRSLAIRIGAHQMFATHRKWLNKAGGLQLLLKDVFQSTSDMLLECVDKGVLQPRVKQQAPMIAINIFAFLDGISMRYCLLEGEMDLLAHVNLFLDDLFFSLRI